MSEALWTPEDTEFCKAAVADGLSISIATGKPLTFDELQKMHDEYGKVRGTVDEDAFIKKRIRTEPFDEAFLSALRSL